MNPQYKATIPVFIRTLENLSGMLDKAVSFLEERGMREGELLEGRLAPDQFSFVKQIQIATDNAKNGVARLVAVEPPTFLDEEKNIGELKKRLEKTVAYLKTIQPEQFAESGSRKVILPYFPGKYLPGDEYLNHYLVPNFFFHVVTAYSILRHLGVPFGKEDYLKGLILQDL